MHLAFAGMVVSRWADGGAGGRGWWRATGSPDGGDVLICPLRKTKRRANLVFAEGTAGADVLLGLRDASRIPGVDNQ
jgi:hypothetical protein